MIDWVWYRMNFCTVGVLNSEMEKLEIIVKAEELVKSAMKGNDASHDPAHAFRVRDLALSLSREESLASSPDSLLTVTILYLFFKFKLFDIFLLGRVSWELDI